MSSGSQVMRVVFQILKPGDRLKMSAVSNVSQTGGGARDLRFRPENAFLPVFKRMLPEIVLETRRASLIETYSGTVYWEASGQEHSRKMKVWPATEARRDECRIGGVNHFDFSGLVKDDPAGRRSIFMLFQLRSGVVRVHFTTETSLRSESWNSTIKSFANYWMKTQHRSAFLDLETNERFPDD